jgi:phosphomannomutase
MFKSGSRPAGPAAGNAAHGEYVKRYTDFFPPNALQGLRVVLYQHSAVGRDILAEILRALGAEVHPLGRTETFVPIDTEAISESDLQKLSEFARTASQQFGSIDAIVSTDGDSDRPLIVAVDAGGQIRFVSGDLIGILVSKYLRADAIAVPVSATDAIERAFANSNVEIVRTRIGSPWVIAAMKAFTGKSCVGFEANGGFLVGSAINRDGRKLSALPTRDAVLPILSVLHSAKEQSTSLWKLLESLPRRFGKSGLIDAVAPKELSALTTAVFERHFSKNHGFGRILDIDRQDGVRITFEGGDIAHVRASGNAPQLRIYAFADTEDRANEIVALGIRKPDGILLSLLADVRD